VEKIKLLNQLLKHFLNMSRVLLKQVSSLKIVFISI